MKWRYRIAIALAVIVVIIVAGGAVLFETQAGLRWAVGIAQSHSDGALKIGSVEGKLAGPIKVDNLRLELDGDVITIEHARIDWRPSALAAGKLWIKHLDANDIKIAITPDQTANASTTLPDKLDLPLHIIVDQAEFDSLHIALESSQLQLDHLALSLDAGNEEIKLTGFEARGPRGALAGGLELEPNGAWPVKADLAQILRLPDYPVIEGRSHLEGKLKGSLALTQTLHAPFPATLEATVKQLFTTPRVNGTLRIAALDPSSINAGWPALKTKIQLAFAGGKKAFHASGTLHSSGPYTGTAKLRLNAGFAHDTLTLSQLALTLHGGKTGAAAPGSGGPPARLRMRGKLALNAPYHARFNLDWHNLRWPLFGSTPTVRTASGHARLDGTLDNWQLDAVALLRPGDLPQSRWALDASGSRRDIRVNNLVGRWLDGRIVAHGKLALEDKQPFQFTLVSHNLHTGDILDKLPGQLGFELAAEGKLEPLDATLTLKQFSGNIQEHPVTGQGRMRWTAEKLTLHNLELAAGSNRLEAEGSWGERLDMRWHLHAPELSTLGKRFAGRIEAQGTVSGKPRAPHIRARLEGEALHLDTLQVETIQARTDLHPGPAPSASLQLSIENARRGDLTIKSMTASLAGPADAQHFEIDVQSNDGEAHLSGEGQLGENSWHGHLREGRITPEDAPTFTLQAPATIVIGRKNLTLGQGCWLGQGGAKLCVAAHSDKQDWQTTMQIESLPLALADAYLQNLKLDGRLDGKLQAHGGHGTLDVLATLHAGEGSISRQEGSRTTRFTFKEAGLELHIDNSTAVARLGLLPAEGGMLDLHANIPWREHAKPTGRIRLVTHLPDLSGLDALSTALGNTAGRLDADFTVTGSLQTPRFTGRIRLSDVAFTLPRFGTRINNAQLTLHGEGDTLALSGTLEDSAKGRLSLSGQLERTGQAWALKANIRGKDFVVSDRPEWRIVISPDLDITLRNRVLAINGKIAIPSADITPPNFAGAIEPSSDLVIVGTQKTHAKPPLALKAHLQVSLGEDVNFKGFGLDAWIGGQLAINEQPGELTTASGQLEIKHGEYKAYGQALTIQEGRLLFSGGPIGNPGLNIRATRKVASVTAGLQITGTLRHPRMSVFSIPPMSQSNALSYLLFGHGVQQNSGEENSVQEQAASALGIAGATYVAQSLVKHVGIDTVTVENASRYSTSSNQASLFLGKYLSPRLYVSYGIGLYEPINLLRIRYTLSRHWALEAESGTISGADILYNIAF